MIHRLLLRGLLMPSAVAAAVWTAAASPIAYAQPETEQGECTFKPTAPKVVPVSGTQMVTASMETGRCTIFGNPSGITVCLEIEGHDNLGDCHTAHWSYPVEVYVPYVPGATYVMTGRGCVNIFEAPYKLCQTYGPTSHQL